MLLQTAGKNVPSVVTLFTVTGFQNHCACLDIHPGNDYSSSRGNGHQTHKKLKSHTIFCPQVRNSPPENFHKSGREGVKSSLPAEGTRDITFHRVGRTDWTQNFAKIKWDNVYESTLQMKRHWTVSCVINIITQGFSASVLNEIMAFFKVPRSKAKGMCFQRNEM